MFHASWVPRIPENGGCEANRENREDQVCVESLINFVCFPFVSFAYVCIQWGSRFQCKCVHSGGNTGARVLGFCGLLTRGHVREGELFQSEQYRDQENECKCYVALLLVDLVYMDICESSRLRRGLRNGSCYLFWRSRSKGLSRGHAVFFSYGKLLVPH